jgi:hypothetical protein
MYTLYVYDCSVYQSRRTLLPERIFARKQLNLLIYSDLALYMAGSTLDDA